ncbi:Detected protein of unknown function [Hibiscus syriacus]|uniref:Uncharacterized protein n=1 Tax=Hibiscus syriacus TaxID=106335 RepID=A0A6A3A2E5_HIBSY|nr:uncharacterized protein LOC120135182 [Hibiscus syriacus]KAE8698203.1 Detected protein of unknown function [Hibiscus syriacus]
MESDDNKKRVREAFEEFESEAAMLKLARLDSANNGSDSHEFTHQGPDADDGDIQLRESKIIQEDLLNFLDDSDPVIEPEPVIQGLDSVLKSFEEEILVPNQAKLPEKSSEPGESRPDLGFLFQASDDELGLPPSFSVVEEGQKFGTVDVEESVVLGGDGIGEMMGFEFPIPGYESFEFEIGGDSVANNNNHSNNGDFEAFGGLLETDDGNFGAYVVT